MELASKIVVTIDACRHKQRKQQCQRTTPKNNSLQPVSNQRISTLANQHIILFHIFTFSNCRIFKLAY